MLEEIDGALQITQDGRTYLARNWKLTDELVDVIEIALSHGLTALWRKNHPRDAFCDHGSRFEVGSHHIGFSRNHNESWVFVADRSSTPPFPRRIIFNKKLASYLMNQHQQFQYETGGGHNLIVPRDQLEACLDGLSNPVLDSAFR